MRHPDGSKRGPTDTNLHFVSFDISSLDKTSEGHFELVRILRRRVFVDELHVQHESEFDEYERNSRHVLGFLGDAPVSYARWRLDGEMALIDRLCTLRGYRNRNVARRCLESVARDIVSTTTSLCINLHCMIILVPMRNESLQKKLANANFAPKAESSDQRVPSIQMCISASALHAC